MTTDELVPRQIAAGNPVPATWNSTASPYDEQATIVDLVERAVAQWPSATALETSDGAVVTYTQLWERTLALAGRLRVIGVSSGDFVAVADSHTEWTVISELAINLVGAAFVPLDSRWPIARVASIVDQLERLSAVVTGPDLAGRIEGALWASLRASTPIVIVGSQSVEELVDENLTTAFWDEIGGRADLSAAAGFDDDAVSSQDVGRYLDRVRSLVLSVCPRGRVFEVGCGAGLVARTLVDAGFRYGGSDPSSVSLARLQVEIGKNAFITRAFAHTTQLPPDVDTVVLASVSQFFPDLRYAKAALSHLLHQLPAGGSLIVADVIEAADDRGPGQLSFPAPWFAATFGEANVDVRLRDSSDWDGELGRRLDVIISAAGAATSDIGPGASTKPAVGLANRSAPTDVAYAIFTSGSTGVPKGVVVEHTSVVNLVAWFNGHYSVAPGDRLLWVTSSAFDLSIYDLFGVLAAGATVCIPAAGILHDADRLHQELVQREITLWDSAPAAFEEVLRAATAPAPRLRKVFLSGDWVPVTLPDRMAKPFPKATLSALGGATEATIWSNYFDVLKTEPDWPSIPYGRPVANARYYVLDDAGNQTVVGTAGNLHIAGVPVARGYLGRTDDHFGTDPFVPELQRMYATGDRAVWLSSGEMQFLGRTDDQVKIRGYRVDLGDVRSALVGVAGVGDVVVVTHRDESGDRLVAAVTGKPGEQAPSVAALRRECNAHLPYYMMPNDFLVLPILPVGPTGKVDRHQVIAAAENERQQRRWLPMPAANAAVVQAAQYAPPGTLEFSAELVVRGAHSLNQLRSATLLLFTQHPELAAELAILGDNARWRLADLQRAVHERVALGESEVVDLPEGVPFSMRANHVGDDTVIRITVHHGICDGSGLARILNDLLVDLSAADTSEWRSGASKFALPVSGGEPHYENRSAWEHIADRLNRRPRVTLNGRQGHPIEARRQIDPSTVAASGHAAGTTSTVALLVATRSVALTTLGVTLDRISVPMASVGDSLLSVRILPLIDEDPVNAEFAEECARIADVLYASIDRGAPPADLTGRLGGSALVGLPDVLVSIAPNSSFPTGSLLVRRVPQPARGCPAVLTVELDGDILRVVGHSAVLNKSEVDSLATGIVKILNDPRSMVSAWSKTTLAEIARSRCVVPAQHMAAAAMPVSDEAASTVRRAWHEVMGSVPGDGESLFEVGADSILIARLVGRLRQMTSIDIPLRVAFENSTPAAMAAWLTAHAAEAVASPAERVLADVWSEVLATGPIEAGNSFLELGGHSLLAMRVVTELSKRGWGLSIEPLLAGRPFSEVVLFCIPRDVMPTFVGGGDSGPASPSQERAFVEMQIALEESGSPTGNEGAAFGYQFQAAFRIHGTFDPERWRAAADTVIARNDVLRMAFTYDDSGLRRRVLDRRRSDVHVDDWRASPPNEVQLEQWLNAHETAPWDLAEGSLVRWAIARVSDEHWVISHVEHHFVHDGISFARLLDQLFAAYRGESFQPAKAEDSFGAWCDWFANRTESAVEADRAYWRTYLADAPAAPARPPVRALTTRVGPRPAGAVRSFVAAETRMRINRSFPRASEFAVLSSAFAKALASVSGMRDIVIGSALPGRPAGAEDCIGMFVTTVCLRMDTRQPDQDIIDTASADIARALDHQLVAFNEVVREWRATSGAGRGLPFEAMFSLHNADVPPLEFGDMVQASLEYRQNGTAKVPLDIVIIERRPGIDGADEDDLELVWEFDLDRYGEADIRLLSERFHEEVDALTGKSRDGSLSSTVLGPSIAHADLSTVMRSITQNRGTGESVRWRGESLSHRALSERLLASENYDSPLLMADDRSAEFVVKALARLNRGTPVVAIREADRNRGIQMVASSDLPPGIAYAVLTSGTSGVAKFTAIARVGLANHIGAFSRVLGIDSDDIVFSCSAFGFDAFWEEMLVSLSAGASLILADLDGDALSLVGQIEESRATIACMTTELFHLVVDELERTGGRVPASLRQVVIGGERYDDNRLRTWSRLAGADSSRVINTYGPTEATIGPLFRELVVGTRVTVQAGKNLIGQPLDNVAVRVASSDGATMPRGAVGELLIGGPGVAIGYLGQPGMTASRFPTIDGTRWYRTGDLARMDTHGTVEYLGREDDQIKIRGYRVEPSEVEALLVRCPLVRRAVVVASPDSTGGSHLTAFAVATGPADEIVDWARGALPAQLIPAVEVVSTFPLTDNGKIDRRALKARALGSHRTQLRAVHVSPRPGREALLAEAWREVLDTDKVGRGDSFLDLGGHSLLAMRVLALVRERGRIVVPLRQLLSARSLAEVAAESSELTVGT